MSVWWTLDRTLDFGINACGQLVELRAEPGQWVVRVHTPMFPNSAPMTFLCETLDAADDRFWSWIHARRDELDGSPLGHWKTIQRMRLHPSWDHDAEDLP